MDMVTVKRNGVFISFPKFERINGDVRDDVIAGARVKNTIDIVNIGLHFFLKNIRPYATSCSEA